KEVAVANMGKAPPPGTGETRPCPPLPAAEAAAPYRGFLLGKNAAGGGPLDTRPAAGHPPGDARPELHGVAPGCAFVALGRPDLGARLHATLAGLLAAGHAGAIAVDSDTPTLPSGFLQQAVDCLSRPGPDVVLGPTEDGGYYLIGIRAPHRELFETMPWSTSDVLEITRRRADAAGLRAL